MPEFLRNLQLSIFHKLVLSFLVIIIPFSLLSLQMNKWGEAVAEERISEAILSQVRFYTLSIDSELQRIRKQQQDLVNNKYLIKLSSAGHLLPIYEKIDLILILLSAMQSVKNSSDYIKNITVYMPIIDTSLSTEQNIGAIDKSELEELYQATTSSDSNLIFLHNRLFINLFFPNPLLKNEPYPSYFISIELSVEYIKFMLRGLLEKDSGGAALLHDDLVITFDRDIDKVLSMDKSRSHTSQTSQLKLNNETYFTATESSGLFDYQLMIYYRDKLLSYPLKQYQTWFWMITGCSIAVIIVVSYGIYRMIHRPILQLVRAFRKVEAEYLEIIKPPYGKDEFRYLFDQFNEMVNVLKHSIHQAIETKMNMQRTQLKQLQLQINPHFLYNTYFILNEMVQHHDDDDLKKFTDNLGRLFQYITKDSHESVFLETEILFAQTYTSVQAIRFSDRIAVVFEPLPEAYAHLIVPRMILQPIIENVYHHGLQHAQVHGRLHISFSVDGSSLIIYVEDNGTRLTADKLEQLNQLLKNTYTGEVTGMVNVHRRLQLFYGAHAGLSLSISQYGGLCVAIRVSAEIVNS